MDSIPEMSTLLGLRLDDVTGFPFIREINPAPKVQSANSRHYLQLKEAGLVMATACNGHVESIFLHADGVQGCRQWPHPLPAGLSFADARLTVRQKLGPPSRSEPQLPMDPRLHNPPPWDRWDLPTHSLHIQYTPDQQSILLLTLMSRLANAV
jgi:hypothetical protein